METSRTGEVQSLTQSMRPTTRVSNRQPILRFLIGTAAFVIVVAGIKAASPIAVPFLMALFVAVITTPIFLALQRRGVPSWLALLALIFGLVLIVIGLLGVVSNSVADFTRNLPEYQERLQTQLNVTLNWIEAKGIDVPAELEEITLNPQATMRFVANMLASMGALLSSSFLILLITVFFLLEVALLPNKIKGLAGLSAETVRYAGIVVEDIRHYVALKTVMSLLTGALVTGFAMVLGIDYPILLGLMAFMLNYVPTIGSIIAAVPGVLLAVVQFGVSQGLVAALGYIVINVGVSNILEPRYLGRGLGLSPFVIVISMFFWGWVLGPVGMLLSVPLTMVVKIALDASPESRWIAVLMGDKAAQDVEPPDSREANSLQPEPMVAQDTEKAGESNPTGT
jgi:predicted PurR-regulated permease PerM